MSRTATAQTQMVARLTVTPIATGTLQRAAINPSPVHDVPPIVHDVLRSPGQPLDAATRSFMEPRFRHDFSRIPTHSPATGAIQTKLAINKPGDEYEQEADRVADQVLAAPAHSTVSGASPRIQRYAGQATEGTTAPASVDRVLAGSGRSLDSAFRQDMEQRFGHDFSQVRVHTGGAAEQSAQEVNAHAYTVGHNVVFGAGQFNPETHGGRRLIAHELTHVVQQGVSANGLHRAAAAQSEADFAKGHKGEVNEVSPFVDAPSNEFLFWNYLVGVTELRREHQDRLKSDIIPRWLGLLSSRPDLRIKIVGSASASGGRTLTTELALGRAEKLRAFLISNGIPADGIDAVGIGSSRPLADENSPSPELANENKARNRRVEISLFVPTRTVAALSQTVQPKVTDFNVKFNSVFVREFNRENNTFSDIAARSSADSFAMIATAKAQLDGPPDAEIGFIQFLTQDIRMGVYKSGNNKKTVLDWGQCSSQFLPCRDVEEATSTFSATGTGLSARPPTPTPVDIMLRDSPGTVFPIRVSEAGDPRANDQTSFFLDETDWLMEFVLVLGVRLDADFLPLQHVIWHLESSRFDVNSGDPKGQPSVKEDSRGPGMPSGLNADAAMRSRTCRALLRRIDFPKSGVCRPRVTV
jgi:outer membrane protein OmpA-like peptidoglycan-associated protein